MAELEAVWAGLSQAMQAQVRTAIVNMVAERDGEKVAAWSTVRSILTEASYLGWQRVWRMVGAMPADAQPVVTSAFADTPVDIRGRVWEIVATRAIADTLHDQRLAASVSRVEGVDQAGLAELASEGIIVEQNAVYHLPKGSAFVVSVDAQGYREAAAMKLDEALELPSLVCRKIEQNHDLARRDGDETVSCQIKSRVIVAEVAASRRGGRRARCGTGRWPSRGDLASQGSPMPYALASKRIPPAPSPETVSRRDRREPRSTAGTRFRAPWPTGSFRLKPQGARTNLPCESSNPLTNRLERRVGKRNPGYRRERVASNPRTMSTFCKGRRSSS